MGCSKSTTMLIHIRRLFEVWVPPIHCAPSNKLYKLAVGYCTMTDMWWQSLLNKCPADWDKSLWCNPYGQCLTGKVFWEAFRYVYSNKAWWLNCASSIFNQDIEVDQPTWVAYPLLHWLAYTGTQLRAERSWCLTNEILLNLGCEYISLALRLYRLLCARFFILYYVIDKAYPSTTCVILLTVW